VFLDNSCFSFLNCDPYQNPAFELGQTTYDYLAEQSQRADDRGQLLFVVMHMPTQDPRPGHTQPTPGPHTMGEGISPDNALFEQAAAAAGVDAVFAGHVKGQWVYEAGGVPYFTDGGAGGEVYVGAGEETGVDSGYWHGYRLIRARRGRVRTDAVPVFRQGGVAIDGPRRARPGELLQFTAAGRQPTTEGPAVTLELREPDPSRPNAANLPSPARIWSTRDRRILRPVAVRGDDPRRNPRLQTVSGRFRAKCPGFTVIRVKSGWEAARYGVRVRGDAPLACR